MTVEALAVFPDEPRFVQRFTFGARKLRAAIMWRPRLGSWILDLYDADDTPIALGRRLSPGWMPLYGLALGDDTDRDTVLLVQGPSPYRRDDLGARLQVLVVPIADLPTAAAATGVTITNGS